MFSQIRLLLLTLALAAWGPVWAQTANQSSPPQVKQEEGGQNDPDNKGNSTDGMAQKPPLSSRPATTEVVNVHGTPRDDYGEQIISVGNLDNAPLVNLPFSATIIPRELINDQQSRLLSDVAKNDSSVGEDYAPVGYYEDFAIRGFALDLATGFQINGLTIAGQQNVALENKEQVEFLKGLAGIEGGVMAPGGLVNYVTKRPRSVRSITAETDERGGSFGAGDFGVVFGSREQYGVRINVAAENIHSYVTHADGHRVFGAFSTDWKITDKTILKVDFEDQTRSQHSVSGYQLLGGTTIPAAASPFVMLGEQSWAKPVTIDAYDVNGRFEHTFNPKWRAYIAMGRSQSIINDNVAYAYGCSSCTTTPIYFFGPDGEYDIYDYRNPEDTRRNDQVEPVVSGSFATWRLHHNLSVGGSVFRVTVDQNDAVYDYVGTENIHDNPKNVQFLPSPNRPGNYYRRLDSRQYSAIWLDRIDLTHGFQIVIGGREVILRNHAFTKDPVSQITSITPTDNTKLLPQIALLYKPAEQVTFYGSFSEAISLGNQAPFWASNANEFLPPFVSRQFEVGTKYLRNSSLQLGTAAFRITSPFQYPKYPNAAVTTPPPLTTPDFVQQGQELHEGIEVSAAGRVAARLNVFATATASHDVATHTGTTTYDGKQLLNVPHFRSAISGDYGVPRISGLHLLGAWQYTGAKAATRDDVVHVPDYHIFNAGLRYTIEAMGRPIIFRAYVDNLFDKRSWKDTGTSVADSFLHQGAPRTASFGVEYNF